MSTTIGTAFCYSTRQGAVYFATQSAVFAAGARKGSRLTQPIMEPVVEVLSDEDGGGYMAHYPTLGKYTACGTSDNSPEEAIARLKDIAPQVVAHLESLGYTV